MFEVLERRMLLAATLDRATGLLRLTGTDGNDSIRVDRRGNDLRVSLNDKTTLFPLKQVKNIVASAYTGEDSILLTPGVAAPSTLNGGAGNDTLHGGAGGDLLKGAAGNDTLRGRLGADMHRGGSGADTADYSERKNSISILVGDGANDGRPGEGDDVKLDIEVLVGGSAGDTFQSGDFDNTLIGNAGNDKLCGCGGNDLLEGGFGDDTLDGGTGADTLRGGEGRDTADYSARIGNLNLSADDVANDGEVAEDDLLGSDVEVLFGAGDDLLVGNEGDDRLVGNAGDDTLRGLAGDDTLDGGSGDDSLSGGDQDDTLDGQAGEDTLAGDDGDDRLRGGVGADVFSGGDGTDIADYSDHDGLLTGDGVVTVQVSVGNLADDGIYVDSVDVEQDDVQDDVENVIGTAGDDFLVGNDSPNVLDGRGGNDFIFGLGGDDTLLGGGGSDELTGNDGDDLLDGAATGLLFPVSSLSEMVSRGRRKSGPNAPRGLSISLDNEPDGADVLIGSEGDDHLRGGDADDTLVGSQGEDLLFGDEGDDDLSGEEGNDELNGNDGDDTLRGGIDDDTLTGGLGDDFVQGEDGNDEVAIESGLLDGGADTVEGGAGDDLLQGSGASEVIVGDEGNDTISAGAGDDVLHGGEGDDLLNAGDGDDTLGGGFGLDTLNADAGDDLFVNAEGEADTLDGADGDDAAQDEPAGVDSLAGVEFIYDPLDPDGAAADSDERLDSSPLPAVAAASGVSLVSNTLTITGSDDADTILITQQGGNVIVNSNGQSQSFADSAVLRVVINADAGDDFVRLANADNSNALTRKATLDGGAGNDTLIGGSANDVLFGGAGDDSLNGNSGNDILGGGTPTGFSSVPDGADTFVGGAGSDRLDYSRRKDDLEIFLNDPTAGSGAPLTMDAPGENDRVLSGFEIVFGGKGNDRIVGDGQANFLAGGAGDDTLFGNDGKDFLNPALGNDAVFGGAGGDFIQIDEKFRDEYNPGPGKNEFVARDVGGPNADILVPDVSP